MDIEQKLDHSSPIVQRVLLLRERMVQQKTLTATLTSDDSSVADMTRMKKMYEWQMWQKSDPYAYLGGGTGHRCK
jgi:hypothetical protein